MFAVDVDKLLQPVTDDAPCGDNREYDASFIQLEKAAQPKPSQQFGETIVPGEDPDWRQVKQLASELLEETRDLRVLLHLTHAALHTDGIPAFGSCVAGFAKLVDERWAFVHPQLDPDDDNDPTMRVNLVAALNDEETTIKYLRDAELVKAKTVGRFSLRDLDIANGDIQPVASDEQNGKTRPTAELVRAAFSECVLEELQLSASAARAALQAASDLENALTRQVGIGQSASLAELRRTLQRMVAIYDQHLLVRGVGVETAADEAGADGTGGANGAPQRLTGEICSREDVVRAIDKICDYYARHEPSSPLPLLLRRAKRLTNKSFLEIVRDLSPDALQQVLALGGEEESEQDN